MSYWEQLERPGAGRGHGRRRRAAPPQPRAAAAALARRRVRRRARRQDRDRRGAGREHGGRRAARGHGRGRPRPRPRRGSPDRPPLLLLGRTRWSRSSRRSRRSPAQRILVAGIGNVFFGDDGFGVAVAGRLAASRRCRAGVDVVDFGIRGMDLAYALRDYDVAIFVDAVPRGGAPGTLYVIEPDLDGARGRARRPRDGPGEGARARRRGSGTRCHACWSSAASRAVGPERGRGPARRS